MGNPMATSLTWQSNFEGLFEEPEFEGSITLTFSTIYHIIMLSLVVSLLLDIVVTGILILLPLYRFLVYHRFMGWNSNW